MKNRIFGLALALAMLWSTDLRAQEPSPHDRVRNALVSVIVRGADTEHGNASMTARGTGFIVNADGLVVTSYHLRRGLNVDPGTVTYQVVVSNGLSQTTLDAEFVDADVDRDLLLLMFPTHGVSTPALAIERRPRDNVVLSTTQIYVSGYPDAVPYFATAGRVAGFQGPMGMLQMWPADYRSLPGLSGAPVYLADGRVLGVNTGVFDANTSVAYFVPSNWIARLVSDVVVQPNAVHVTVVADALTQENRVFEFESSSAGHCVEGRVAVEGWRVQATPGWQIVTTTVSTEVLAREGASVFLGFRSLSSEEMELAGYVENSGNCVRDGGAIVPSDQVGRLRVRVVFAERPRAAQRVVFEGLVQPGRRFALPASVLEGNTVVHIVDSTGRVERAPIALGDNGIVSARRAILDASRLAVAVRAQ